MLCKRLRETSEDGQRNKKPKIVYKTYSIPLIDESEFKYLNYADMIVNIYGKHSSKWNKSNKTPSEFKEKKDQFMHDAAFNLELLKQYTLKLQVTIPIDNQRIHPVYGIYEINKKYPLIISDKHYVKISENQEIIIYHKDKILQPNKINTFLLFKSINNSVKKFKFAIHYLKISVYSIFQKYCLLQFSNLPLYELSTLQTCKLFTVDHIDEDPTNNKFHNLQIMVSSHNASKSLELNPQRKKRVNTSISRPFRYAIAKKREDIKNEDWKCATSTHDPIFKEYHRGCISKALHGKRISVGCKDKNKNKKLWVYENIYEAAYNQFMNEYRGINICKQKLMKLLNLRNINEIPKNKQNLLISRCGKILLTSSITYIVGNPLRQYRCERIWSKIYIHVWVYFTFITDEQFEAQFPLWKTGKLTFTYDLSNTNTFEMYDQQNISVTSKQLDKPYTFEEYLNLDVVQKKSVRILYSNRFETLSLISKSESCAKHRKFQASYRKMMQDFKDQPITSEIMQKYGLHDMLCIYYHQTIKESKNLKPSKQKISSTERLN